MISTLEETDDWFDACYPAPTTKNLNTQMGVHFEEVGEMIDEVTPTTSEAEYLFMVARKAISKLSMYLKETDGTVIIKPENRIGYIDAICDQIVTATGCAHMSQMNLIGAMDEVNRSNYSKFDETGHPIFDENLKVAKGPNYTKANLAPFV